MGASALPHNNFMDQSPSNLEDDLDAISMTDLVSITSKDKVAEKAKKPRRLKG